MATGTTSIYILFTKVPVPGLVKTRLTSQNQGIDSAPTNEEVADLYKATLCDTLIALKEASERNSASFMLSFSPANKEKEMQAIVEDFFPDAVYHPQQGINVTEKVRGAFDHAFGLGYRCAALVPGDHPDLDGEILCQALSALDRPDPQVVLGPTFDGGAYLLGFNNASFDSIKFNLENTYLVCADIFLKAKEAKIPCCFLNNRNDIDDWDDARRFLRSRKNLAGNSRKVLQRLIPKAPSDASAGKRKLSIVIPALNEETGIPALLGCLDEQTDKDFETILVDGSSADGTVQKAWGRVEKIAFVDKPSRKYQENVGAYAARGEVILFLHADSLVSRTLCESVLRRSQSTNIIGGSCHAVFDGEGVKYSFLNALRTCGNELLGIHGISSGFFVRRDKFLAAQGFRTDVMEEAVDLERRIGSPRKFVFVDEAVVSSSRRFRSRRTFVPTLAVWITTVLLTATGLHFTAIEEKLWKSVR